MQMNDEVFSKIISEALDQLPEKYVSRLDNVAITYEDEPSPEQRKKLKLRCSETLFGLYEGIPTTSRGSSYSLVLPDKITVFKLPILSVSKSTGDVKKQVKHTLWHEIAHYFGLGHDEIHAIEERWK